MADVLDIAHSLVVDGSDAAARMDLEAQFEPLGHQVRANLNPAYKRATWGRRPEDVEALRAVVGDVEGRSW